MEEKKLALRDRVQIYIKNQKRISGKALTAIIIVLAIIVCGSSFIPSSASGKNDSASKYTDERIVKGTVVGDIMLGRSIKNKSSKTNYSDILDNVSSIWKDSDYVSGNLECAVLDNPDKFEKNDKEIHINAETKSVNVLKDNGFTLINLANNHLADFCSDGVISTVNTLQKAGLKYVGAGKNITEASKYDIQEVNGVKIATVSVSDIVPKNFSATDSKAGILSTKTSAYYNAVRQASQEADLVVVNIHWGVEYGLNQSERQEELARNLINFGADIVIGSHPHVLQPVEKYKDGIIFYSMGNFVFDQGWSRTKDSMVLNYFVDKDGNCSFEMIPVRIKDGYPTVTNNPFFTKRTFNTLTKKLKDSDYEVKSNTILLKNAIKVDLKKNDTTTQQTDSQNTTGTDNQGTQGSYNYNQGTQGTYNQGGTTQGTQGTYNQGTTTTQGTQGTYYQQGTTQTNN